MKLFFLLALTATTFAETTLLSAFNAAQTTLPITGAQGSVVSANPSETIIAVQCIQGNQQCVLQQPVTLTEGPSTHAMSAVFSTESMALPGSATMIENCAITSSTISALCTVSLTLELSPPPQSSTGDSMTASATVTGSMSTTSRTYETNWGMYDIYYKPLTVTAGVGKLNVPTPSATDAGAGVERNVGIGGAAAAAVAAAAML